MALRVLVLIGLFGVCLPAVCSVAGELVGGEIGLSFSDSPGDIMIHTSRGELVTVYVLITDPNFENLDGWEMTIRSATSELIVMSSSLAGGGVNSAISPEFSVTYEAPLAVHSVTLLGNVVFLAAGYPECLYMTGYVGSSVSEENPVVWIEGGVAAEISRNLLWENGVSAAMGDHGVLYPTPCVDAVAVASYTWGAIKATYR